MEHTQGPWRLIGPWETLVQAGRAGRTIELATVAAIGGKVGKEVRANAHLIASAPALLEALRELAEIGEGGVIERRETGKPIWSALDAIKTIARAAIAKAQGGSIS